VTHHARGDHAPRGPSDGSALAEINNIDTKNPLLTLILILRICDLNRGCSLAVMYFKETK